MPGVSQDSSGNFSLPPAPHGVIVDLQHPPSLDQPLHSSPCPFAVSFMSLSPAHSLLGHLGSPQERIPLLEMATKAIKAQRCCPYKEYIVGYLCELSHVEHVCARVWCVCMSWACMLDSLECKLRTEEGICLGECGCSGMLQCAMYRL